eukprot:gene20472-7131_t
MEGKSKYKGVPAHVSKANNSAQRLGRLLGAEVSKYGGVKMQQQPVVNDELQQPVPQNNFTSRLPHQQQPQLRSKGNRRPAGPLSANVLIRKQHSGDLGHGRGGGGGGGSAQISPAQLTHGGDSSDDDGDDYDLAGDGRPEPPKSQGADGARRTANPATSPPPHPTLASTPPPLPREEDEEPPTPRVLSKSDLGNDYDDARLTRVILRNIPPDPARSGGGGGGEGGVTPAVQQEPRNANAHSRSTAPKEDAGNGSSSDADGEDYNLVADMTMPLASTHPPLLQAHCLIRPAALVLSCAAMVL